MTLPVFLTLTSPIALRANRVCTCIVALAATVMTCSEYSLGEDVLYSNLDNVRSDSDWFTPLGPDRRFAQQFLIEENTNIDQVTVHLQRPRRGATGRVGFELWSDNGSGQPMPVGDPNGKIADLGEVIDIEDVPIGEFAEYTFDNLVLGLEPNKPYWVVSNYTQVRNISGGEQSIGTSVIVVADDYPPPPGYDPLVGTNGAAYLHAYRAQDPFWENLKQVFGVDHLFQAMRVEAMDGHAASPTHTEVGEPNWKVGDIHHFSGPASSVSEWRQTVDKVSPPSTHCTPRDVPHDNLWAEAIADAGFEEATTFLPSAIDTSPNGVFTTVRLLPDPGETGSSLDAESGPIIPVDLLPIHATWQWTQDGKVLDGFSSNFARPDCLVTGVDGLSSFQQIGSIDASLFPPGTELVGSYETRLQIRDSQGNGWDVAAPFEIVSDVAGDVLFDGVLDAVDIDMVTSAVRQSLTDSTLDMNQDGQVNVDDRTYWVHDLAHTYFGDSNLDGVFNSGDLTLVFQAGEYEDNITLNSTWAEGDWNGDGDFESSDLVTAFQDGGYEMGPRAAVSAVPEPTCGMLLAIGMLAIWRLRER